MANSDTRTLYLLQQALIHHKKFIKDDKLDNEALNKWYHNVQYGFHSLNATKEYICFPVTREDGTTGFLRVKADSEIAKQIQDLKPIKIIMQ